MSQFRFVTLLVLVALLATVARADDEKKSTGEKDTPNAEMKVFNRSSIVGRLRLYSPVPIHGPYPYLLYTAKAGDLVQLQLSYPISPPFPRSVRVSYDSTYFDVIDVVGTDNEVVVLKPGQSQTGMIGLGHYSLFLKAKTEGRTRVDIKVTLEDGDSETIPFNFQIGVEALSARHGSGEGIH